MTSKDRMMCALRGEKPDRLPASVHQWQPYHLDTHMGGISDLEAFRMVGLDAQIQYFEDMDQFWLADSDFTRMNTPQWRDEATVLSSRPDSRIIHHAIHTPEGVLTYKTAGDRRTTWITEYLIKKEEDIFLLDKYMPVPELKPAPIIRKYAEVGDEGILRGFVWGDQGGCWQHAACLMDIQDLIMAALENPGWVHQFLRILLGKKLQFIESMKGVPFDLVETGGGSGSSTLISPRIHEDFCLPYDREMHDALHSLGFLITYHICGGSYGIEDLVAANGADVFETLAPPSVGGNQEPWEFKAKTGRRMALIGGLDQSGVLTEGSPQSIRSKVHELFEKVGPDGGYICSTSDHFFETPIANLKVFAAAARECLYG